MYNFYDFYLMWLMLGLGWCVCYDIINLNYNQKMPKTLSL